jgi:hypothetical protein
LAIGSGSAGSQLDGAFDRHTKQFEGEERVSDRLKGGIPGTSTKPAVEELSLHIPRAGQ